MTNGITVKILGDFGPFSRVGKSIGYLLTMGESSYLIDCGAPPFMQIGSHTIKNIDGIIITHSHDDHKRWFTDIALFYLYENEARKKIMLLTAEDIHEEIIKSSSPALDRSLSQDSKNVIDIPHDDYMNYRMIGPRARYRIVSIIEGNGNTKLCIKDSTGSIIGPDKAKIIINQKTGRPRMLFKDPSCGEWIEPESFYSFSSNIFYEKDKNVYTGKEGFTMEAIKAPVWHGISGIGVKISTENETLIFSSDTAHDKDLWKQLCTEKRKQNLKMSKKDFENAAVIYGDINDYIERTWSEERYGEAVNAFRDAIVIHDISASNSVVHTDYELLKNTFLKKENSLLTHSPDVITSEWVLCGIGKTYQIIGNKFFEKVDNRLYPMNADIYHRDGEKYYVGYKNENGNCILYENDGLLKLSNSRSSNKGKPLYILDLYEDISGKYFPFIDNENAMYFERKDGKVELIEFSNDGSRGKVMENLRDKINKENEETDYVDKDKDSSIVR